MTPANSKINFAPRNTITDNLVFIDGLMRTGKHLTANIVASFERCEMWQNLVLTESVPIYHTLGKLTTDAAIQMIQTEVDLHFYNSLIGRRVNFRYNDASSIWNSRNPGEYLQRVGSSTEHSVLDRLEETNPISLVFTHEVMCHPGIVFAAYPNIRILLSQRNPVELIESWIRKKWGSRIGLDPVASMPALETKHGPVPWFACDWQNEFLEMGNVDRIIHSIGWLQKRENAAIEKLSGPQSKQVLKVFLEAFSVNPKQQIGDMCTFLGTELSSVSQKTFEKLGIPKTSYQADYDRKLESILEQSDAKSIELLSQMTDQYNRDFKNACGLDFPDVLK